MIKVTRYDRSRLDKAERTPQGFLRAPAYLTRVGVFPYRKADGSIRRELRLPEEVFRPESMKTLVMAPLTNDHPNVAVSPSNVKAFQIGVVGEQIEQAEDKFIGAVVTVMDADAIRDVEAGIQELSCGYDCDLEDASGEWEGQPYDAIQRNIKYNHVALVPKGRAGRDVKLRLDSAIQLTTEENAMEKITINGVEYDCTPELKKAIEAELAKNATAVADAKKDMVPAADLNAVQEEKKMAQDQVGELQKKADETQAKLDSANEELKKRNDSAEKVEEYAKELLKVRKVAKAETKLDAADIEKKSVADLKVEVLKANKVDVSGKSQDYINARFDSICEKVDREDADREKSRQAFEARFNPRKDADIPDSKKKRDEMIKRNQEKWKTNPADSANKQ